MTGSKLFCADWVLPADAAPIQNGVVQIVDGIIESVERYVSNKHSTSDLIQLEGRAVIPGLINAHTHLEFSHLAEPLGEPGMKFTEWIKLVVSERAAQPSSIEVGIAESLAAGVVGLAEIATTQWHQSFSNQGIEIVSCLERLGNLESRHPELLEGATGFLAQQKQGFDFGLSPHAPYSVPLSLLEKLVKLQAGKQSLFAMHLAETRQELEYLRDGSGEFVELLDFLGASPASIPRGCSVLDYLKLLSERDRVLVVHGNYLTDEEIEFVSLQRGFSVVFCPRTHRFFQHERYQLSRLLDNQINVAVGTDSRASNPDLSVWQELKTIARLFPEVDRQTILRMGTLAGAKALGQSTLGEIRPGMRARLLSIEISDSSEDPYGAILDYGDNCPLPVSLS